MVTALAASSLLHSNGSACGCTPQLAVRKLLTQECLCPEFQKGKYWVLLKYLRVKLHLWRMQYWEEDRVLLLLRTPCFPLAPCSDSLDPALSWFSLLTEQKARQQKNEEIVAELANWTSSQKSGMSAKPGPGHARTARLKPFHLAAALNLHVHVYSCS